MGIRKTIVTVITAAMVMSMTACANNEKPSIQDKTQSGSAATNSSGNYPDKPFGLGDDIFESPKQVSMWDVLPEIPVTDASAFTYKYDSKLGGMVIIDYLRESPKVRIPDKIEGEPVVEVDLRLCKKELTQLVMPDTAKEFSFSSAIKSSLQYINHPRDMETVNFNGCKNLEAVYIAEGATEIYGKDTTNKAAFYGCEKLSTVYIPNSVTAIGNYVFYGCTSLTSITIPDSVTEIGNSAFESCESLISINIPNGVKIIGEAVLRKCTSLERIIIPDSVIEIGESAFNSCTSLTTVTIPSSVTVIGAFAFNFTPWLNNKRAENPLVMVNNILIDGQTCSGDITIPSGVTTICKRAFSGCENLTSLTIPDSVTEIGDYAFTGCRNLTNLTIPDSVTQIGSFYRTSFTNITYKGVTYDEKHIDDLITAINSN